MATRTLQARLDDMSEAIAGIQETLRDKDYAAFAQVWHLQKATERGLEIISEGSRSIPDDLKARVPDVPWAQIAGIGNVLRHDYQRVEPLIVWNIVQTHLPVLEAALTIIRKAAD